MTMCTSWIHWSAASTPPSRHVCVLLYHFGVCVSVCFLFMVRCVVESTCVHSLCTYSSVCVCVCVAVEGYVFLCACARACVCVCVCVCACVRACVCLCAAAHVCLHTHDRK